MGILSEGGLISKEIGILMRTAAIFALLLCSTSAFAVPNFEGVIIGKKSTHCKTDTAPVTIAPDGSAMFVVFNYMQIKVRSGTEHMRCDLTLKLAEPLGAPETIQMVVSGQTLLNGGASASATVGMLGHNQALNLDAINAKNGAFSSRVTANLPKGAQQLDVIFEASIQSGASGSSSLISIDELNIGDMSRYRD